MRSETIENYLKTIYNLSDNNSSIVTNQKLADKLNLTPATVTETLKKLHELKYVVYEKSYGTRLTVTGAKTAISIVRRHRLWETFLAKEFGFGWDEVHEIAEELEHIKNDKLIKRLAEKLGNPSFDPHGDPIPDEKGKIQKSNFLKLSDAKERNKYEIVAVTDHSSAYLKYLEKHKLVIGSEIFLIAIEPFDRSFMIKIRNSEIAISSKVAEHLIIKT